MDAEQTVHIYLCIPVCDVTGWAQVAVGWTQIADGQTQTQPWLCQWTELQGLKLSAGVGDHLCFLTFITTPCSSKGMNANACFYVLYDKVK